MPKVLSLQSITGMALKMVPDGFPTAKEFALLHRYQELKKWFDQVSLPHLKTAKRTVVFRDNNTRYHAVVLNVEEREDGPRFIVSFQGHSVSTDTSHIECVGNKGQA